MAIFVRKELQAGVIIPNNNYRPWIETVWLTITIDNNIICFGCAYCSPSFPSQIISKNAVFGNGIQYFKIKSFETIIVGDFNLPEILWIDGYGSSKTKTTGSPFASCLSNNYLYQTVNELTRIHCDQNPSLLDLVIFSSPELLISNDYLPLPHLGKSDHVTILYTINIYSKQTTYKHHSFIDYKAVRRDLACINWSFTTDDDLKTYWHILKTLLLSAELRHASIRMIRQSKTLPYLILFICNLIQRKSKAWKKYRTRILTPVTLKDTR